MAQDLEHHEQAALFQWADLQARRFPELRLMFAIPNGGKRTIGTAKKLKAEGVRRGVPDIFLPVPRGKYHGFFIEMKVIDEVTGRQGRLSQEQRAYIQALKDRGYMAGAFWTWEEAAEAIEGYMELNAR